MDMVVAGNTVPLDALMQAFRQKRGKLPYEIGAFALLEACEQILASPTRIALDNVHVCEDGSIRVEGGEAVSADEATRSLCTSLATVLVGAGPGVPPVMVDLVEQGPSTGDWALTRLRDELEAALVPLNRAAARRVLSRMLREAQGEYQGPRPKEHSVPAESLDAELDGLLGDLGIAAPEQAPPRLSAEALASAGEAPTVAQLGAPTEDATRLAPAIEKKLDQFEEHASSSRSTGPIWAVLFLLMTVGLVALVWVLRPDLVDQVMTRPPGR